METAFAMTIAVVVVVGIAPFVLVWWLLRRGSDGGKVRSLGRRRESGRGVDLHASTDRFDAARDANNRRSGPAGRLRRVRRWVGRLRP